MGKEIKEKSFLRWVFTSKHFYIVVLLLFLISSFNNYYNQHFVYTFLNEPIGMKELQEIQTNYGINSWQSIGFQVLNHLGNLWRMFIYSFIIYGVIWLFFYKNRFITYLKGKKK